MPDVLRRLHGPALLTAAAATIYTTPAGTTTVIRQIHVANTSTTTSATFTMSIGVDAAATRLYSGVLIPIGGTLDWNGLYVLNAGDILQAFASVTSILALTISGIEVT